MKFPDNLDAPARQLAAAVQRYAASAQVKIEKASIDAEEKTARNHALKLEGQDNLHMSGTLFLGFLALMFLYLFVALERHHRGLRALIDLRKD